MANVASNAGDGGNALEELLDVVDATCFALIGSDDRWEIEGRVEHGVAVIDVACDGPDEVGLLHSSKRCIFYLAQQAARVRGFRSAWVSIHLARSKAGVPHAKAG